MSDKIKLAGVVGWPVAHSKSPRLHGYWLRKQDLAGYYVPLAISPEDFAKMMTALPKMGFVGVNVTIPHKEAALAGAAMATDRAKAIGAANTLTFLEDGGYEADNTDGYGFFANLRDLSPNWQPSQGPAAVFGAGGASRAVIHSLLDAGVPEIRLTNRTLARAEALAAEFGPKVKIVEWRVTDPLLDSVAVAVNTTSLGMEGQPAFDLDLSALPAGAIATDIVYTPLMTPFLEAAALQGSEIVDGLGMLLWQGVPGFERWFGGEAAVTEELRERMLEP